MEKILDQAYAAADFRQQGHALIDMLADYLEAAASGNEPQQTIPWQAPDQQLKYWQEDFQKPLTQPLDLFQDVMEKSVKLHSRRFMGHQTAPVLPLSVLATALTACLNQGMAVYEMGMVGNTLEKIVTEHLAQKLGYGPEASGFVTAGGSLGNLTALLAARAAAGDVWNTGYAPGQQLAIMVSEEAHYCIDRAARIMGLGAAGIIKIPVNEQFQLRTDLLEEYYEQARAAGIQVFCVVGCAGSTSTGSYDDLAATAAFCQRHQLWFHIDGAHGAPAAFSPTYKHLVKGMEMADSLVVDFHKMMMTPGLSTAVIFKHSRDAYKTFAQRAQYLWADQETEEWYNGGKRSLECTKTMSVLSVYTLFRIYGEEVFRENIDRLYGLAGTMATLIRATADFELAYAPAANIVCFRYRTADNVNSLNQEIRRLLLEEGTFYIVQTILNGETYLRVSLMNPLTTRADLQELLVKIREKASLLLAR